ncbi:myosin-binding striated muscle assembly central-domain-containing protein [Dichotomopilus funicola]|uniref:Myosin-binding striated muscle assembly central-domain-containing protein n=1 Tax=Dichotomopilus funicola TaxID=1934379 RepID=A0AAN6ZK00_9PEZI|nr:myosin-binding striated muscle assembly central-domain-containing protein [Dichotomopilus funicola]
MGGIKIPVVIKSEITADESVNPTTPVPETGSRQDRTMLLFARVMEGGKEDEETTADLAKLTKLLVEEPELTKQGKEPIVPVIDADCLDTLFGCLDMRQPEAVRTQATLCTAAYLNASGLEGKRKVTDFFHAKMQRATYDDYIVAFCAATAIFPLEYDLMAELFHIEGFLPSLGSLMTRKWKSKKIEMACLKMLNAAAMKIKCHAAIYKYCNEWLDDIISDDIEARLDTVWHLDTDLEVEKEGADELRRHCKQVRNLAGVVYMKISAVPVSASQGLGTEPRKPATDKIEILCNRFAKMIVEDNPENPEYVQYAVEALAYASLRPNIQERLSRNTETLKRLVTVLDSAAPKSPLTYGVLSIFTHLTRYRPHESEEQKRLRQLKAYANAAGKSQPNPLSDDARVTERCKLVFAAGVVPVLVKHCKSASLASLSLIISILFSLSATPTLRGSLAQQGGVRVLLAAWNALPAETEDTARRTAAHGLARILISTNPALVFRQTPQTAAIRPLATLIAPADPTAETRDLLPTFESLLALTNLASTDDDADTTRRVIVRTAWDDIEEQLFSTNTRVSTAAAELLCNLVQSPAAQAQAQATNRTKVILALADADSPKTRSAAGGALASLTAHASIARTILTTAAQPRGLDHILGLCREGQEEGGGESAGPAEAEGIRHRGAVVVANLLSQEGELGLLAREKLARAGAVEALTVCAKKSRTPEVVQSVVRCLEVLLGGE